MLTRRGFTLVEIIVALAVALAMAVVLVPVVVGRVSEGEAAALTANFAGLSDAVASYKSDVGRYPRQLTQLTTAINAGATDLCNVPVPGFGGWKGPYTDRTISSDGLRSGSSLIENDLLRSPPSSVYTTAYGELVFTATDVDESSGPRVDAALDGDGDPGTGPVQWDAGTPSGRGDLTYRIPIRGC